MNYAVVGTGYWGTNHVRVAAELRDAGVLDTVVLCDVDESRVAELADSYDLPYVTDYAALPDEGVQAATVATPSPTHHEIARELLPAGVDLLVEKPLALDADAAWDMVDLADAHDRVLGVGHIFRYHPALRELKRRIDRGELGRIKYLHTRRFTFREPRQSTGVLYSLAVHDVDVSNYLLGDRPDRLYCRMDSHLRPGIDETATLVLEYGDATSVLNESWQVPVFGKTRDLIVVGSEQAAHIDYLEDTVLEMYDSRVLRRDDGFVVSDEGRHVYEMDDREPLRVEVESFVEACEERREPAASGRVGAETVELLEVAAASSDEHRVVSLD